MNFATRLSLGWAVVIVLLIIVALFAGLLPLVMPLGIPAGGVLETGQVQPLRWCLGALGALVAFLLLSRRLPGRGRLWWLFVLCGGLASAVLLFGYRATLDQPHGAESLIGAAREAPPRVGIVSALPLFWPEGQDPQETLRAGPDYPAPLIRMLSGQPVDRLEAATLKAVDVLVLAQPRLLQPEELVAFDGWVRNGGRAVIFADPLLAWPSALPLGDARRPPITSLLDPLLTHWGLRLEPANSDHLFERRMLSTGHVLILAGASRFARAGGGASAPCSLAEGGLMALCRIGKGRVRLVADADLLHERLWLADERLAGNEKAYMADVLPLVRRWIADPLASPSEDAPPRVVDQAALTSAMRWALGITLFWAGLGWAGQNFLHRGNSPSPG